MSIVSHDQKTPPKFDFTIKTYVEVETNGNTFLFHTLLHKSHQLTTIVETCLKIGVLQEAWSRK